MSDERLRLCLSLLAVIWQMILPQVDDAARPALTRIRTATISEQVPGIDCLCLIGTCYDGSRRPVHWRSESKKHHVTNTGFLRDHTQQTDRTGISFMVAKRRFREKSIRSIVPALPAMAVTLR